MGLPLNVENTHIHNPINYGGVEVFNLEVPIGLDQHQRYTLEFEITDGPNELDTFCTETDFMNLQIGYLKVRNLLGSTFSDRSEEDLDKIIYNYTKGRTIVDSTYKIKGYSKSVEEEVRKWSDNQFNIRSYRNYYQNKMSDDQKTYFEMITTLCRNSFYYQKLMKTFEPSDLLTILKWSDKLVFTLKMNLTDEQIDQMFEDEHSDIYHLKKNGLEDPNTIRTKLKQIGCLSFSTTSDDKELFVEKLYKQRLKTQH